MPRGRHPAADCIARPTPKIRISLKQINSFLGAFHHADGRKTYWDPWQMRKAVRVFIRRRGLDCTYGEVVQVRIQARLQMSREEMRVFAKRVFSMVQTEVDAQAYQAQGDRRHGLTAPIEGLLWVIC
jgi:hypothetical protein